MSNTPNPGPRLNPLFFSVLGVVAAATVVGFLADPNKELLQSNLVYRVAIGGAVALVLYLVVIALWLAAHEKTFTKFGFAGGSAEAPDAAADDELRDRDREIAEFMGATTKAIEELERRVTALEP